ncbi:MAG: peptidylprolyl isomerase [Planctomycetota bacterium]
MVLSFEDTPLFDWLKKNRFFLFALALLVVGIQGFQYFAPAFKLKKQTEAWRVLDTINADLAGDFEQSLPKSLAQAKNYPLIYPVFVFTSTRSALIAGYSESMTPLKSALEDLQSSAGAWKAVSENGKVTTVAAELLARVIDYQAKGGTTWENPEPQGARVKVSITSSNDSTYDLIVGLYSDRAPAASAAFLAAVENEQLNGLDMSAFGYSLSIKDFNPDAEEGLPNERQFGLFHLAGALSTTAKPGEPGIQEADSVVFFIQDNLNADGTSSVFGSIVEGLEGLQDALATPQTDVTYKVSSAVVL